MLVGVDAVKGTHGVITISYAALYDAMLAPFVFFLVRRVLGSDDRVRDAWSMAASGLRPRPERSAASH